jgi:hypothetical protein
MVCYADQTTLKGRNHLLTWTIHHIDSSLFLFHTIPRTIILGMSDSLFGQNTFSAFSRVVPYDSDNSHSASYSSTSTPVGPYRITVIDESPWISNFKDAFEIYSSELVQFVSGNETVGIQFVSATDSVELRVIPGTDCVQHKVQVRLFATCPA